MVSAAAAQGQPWATDLAYAAVPLPQLLHFLVSHDGLDFHSDEADEVDGDSHSAAEPSGSPRADPIRDALPAAEELVQLERHADAEAPGRPLRGRAALSRTVLAHTFRSPLAAALLHELDQDSGAPRVQSLVCGAALSVRMAHALLQRPDLTPLFDQDQVAAVAATKKRRAQDDDEDDNGGRIRPAPRTQERFVSEHARPAESGWEERADVLVGLRLWLLSICSPLP
jgi:hypothetical protein